MFFETSALANENITESFQQCARIILNKIESGYFLSLF
jgi:GTPase SAR1 family protein